jgi:hypothetical protein
MCACTPQVTLLLKKAGGAGRGMPRWRWPRRALSPPSLVVAVVAVVVVLALALWLLHEYVMPPPPPPPPSRAPPCLLPIKAFQWQARDASAIAALQAMRSADRSPAARGTSRDPCVRMRASAAYLYATGQASNDTATSAAAAATQHKGGEDDDGNDEVLVFVSNESSGLADHFAGATAALALAMLHRRRLWLHYSLFNMGLVRPAFPHWNYTGTLPPEAVNSQWLGVAPGAFASACWDRLPRLLRVNRGITVPSFLTGTVLADFLRYELGLTAETAYGCLFDTLFQPTPALLAHPALQAGQAQLDAARAAADRTGAGVTVVVLQVRMGDHAFRIGDDGEGVPAVEAAAHTARTHAFVDCAMRVVDGPLLLLLVSDSVLVRQAFAALPLPAHVGRLLAVAGRVDHVSSQQSATASVNSTALALVEHALMARADVWLISRPSGFGVSAAMRSMRANGHVYDGDACAQIPLDAVGGEGAGA